MIVELGHYALVLALLTAGVQAVLPLAGAHYGYRPWIAVARPAAMLQFLLIAVAFAALMHAYVVSDFSVANVARNSHSAKPLLYKITGVWGNHEGSMLLWVLILALCGTAVAAFGRNLPPAFAARVLAVQALVGVGFISFVIFTSNPFARLSPAPFNGRDLNPLLQDPGLAFHPPLLYVGYVGFSTVFSFAVAALIEGRVDPAWARWVRPWTLAAWAALTLGIALGSWWAYYELGWGGWWFWDPVENASFMPWLIGTALLHSAIVVEKRDALKSWTILLAILAFSLSLVGTFLVRSGVLTSVHAFAVDPARGVFILLILVAAIGGSLTLYAMRAPLLKAGGLFAPISREGGLVLNNLALTTAAGTVFLGTLYPLFLEALGGGKVSVGAPYFNATFVPLMVPMIVAMAVGPLLPWKRGDLPGALARLKAAFAASAVVAFGVLYATAGASALAALGLGLAAWVVVGSLAELADRLQFLRIPIQDSWRRAVNLPRATYGMTVAHIGVGVVVAGVTGATAWKVESIQIMRVGDAVTVGGYRYVLDGVQAIDGPNYAASRAEMTVWRGTTMVARLTPEKRLYTVQRMPTTEAAIHTLWYIDLYAVLGEPDSQGGWTTRIYHEPLVPWIWLGALLMATGGALSLSDRRYRIGAPAPRRKRPTAPAPALAPVTSARR